MKWFDKLWMWPLQAFVYVEIAALAIAVSPIILYEKLYDTVEPAEPAP